MRRQVGRLAEGEFDLCVIGGGIYGACVAWDATLRGLSVALVDKGDFGHATSYSSQKTIHGGFRYLQSADVGRLRAAVRERRAWMRIAPHLVHPLPFLIPTYRDAGRSRALLSVAFRVYDLLSIDRNRLVDPGKTIPPGRLASREECLSLFPALDDRALTGGALFHDGLIHSSERLVLSVVRSAAEQGAVVANHVEAIELLQRDDRVVGVTVRDALTKDEFAVRSRMVVNTTGPWINRTLGLLRGRRGQRLPMMKVLYLVARRPVPECAVGLLGRHSRYFFVIPWRGHSLIGVCEHPFEEHELDAPVVRDEEIDALIADINGSRPSVSLTRDDVVGVRSGALPAEEEGAARGELKLATRARIVDHRREEGVEGLISAFGVKFTMARSVAEVVVDTVFRHRGQAPPECRTATTHVYGGDIDRFADFLSGAIDDNRDGFPDDAIRELVHGYGTAYREVLRYADGEPSLRLRLADGSLVLRAQVLHAVREEMAARLADVVVRRTELSALGSPGDAALKACASTMAAELQWDRLRLERELQEVGLAVRTGRSRVQAPVGG